MRCNVCIIVHLDMLLCAQVFKPIAMKVLSDICQEDFPRGEKEAISLNWHSTSKVLALSKNAP